MVTILRADEFESFCSAIGFIEVTWAFLEAQLDRWAQLFFIRLDGKKIERLMPHGFAKKSAFLRKCFNKLPILSPYKDRGLEILDQADIISIKRNDYTHAVVESLKSVNGNFSMINRKLRKDGTHSIKSVQFEVRKFPDLSLKLVRLGRDAVRLSADFVSDLSSP